MVLMYNTVYDVYWTDIGTDTDIIGDGTWRWSLLIRISWTIIG